ncbi:hypothetical protein PG997_010123 [Apiospora hydei]|uniref:FAD-binding domain-containing protein n=1 Tax=Apiospora hydei TaxID=1337664 RepID=A0ABR1VW28_9PEZI
MFGSGPSSPRAQYSHYLGYRSMLPRQQAAAVLGPAKTSRALIHTGTGGYIISFPLAAPADAVHVEAFVADPGAWPDIETDSDAKRYVLPAARGEVAAAFSDFGPTARALVSLLPAQLDKWAVFDMLEAPVPSYSRGPLCLAGDAAHASTPNHGAGAGAGFEDALVLTEVLTVLAERAGVVGADVVTEALGVYSDMRYERSQWLVKSSRHVGDTFAWKDGLGGIDKEKFGRDLEDRSHHLWDYDIDDMVKETRSRLKLRLARAR